MVIEGWGDKGDSAPGTPSGARTPTAEGTPQRRGDFTRQEYERRQQLKIMEDLDKVLRQKPTTVRGVKKQRPKSGFRDDSDISRSPAKGFMGRSSELFPSPHSPQKSLQIVLALLKLLVSCFWFPSNSVPGSVLPGSRLNKVYSHSTMNLSSMAQDSGNLAVRKSPRYLATLGCFEHHFQQISLLYPSPFTHTWCVITVMIIVWRYICVQAVCPQPPRCCLCFSRSHSPGRRMSPGSHHNGDKDWENGSTISSPASIPEYTG